MDMRRIDAIERRGWHPLLIDKIETAPKVNSPYNARRGAREMHNNKMHDEIGGMIYPKTIGAHLRARKAASSALSRGAVSL